MSMSGGAVIMDGKVVAGAVLLRTAGRVKALVEKTGVVPCLATVLLGRDARAARYIRMKHERCAAAGIRYEHVAVGDEATTQEVVRAVEKLNARREVHGIFVQLPVAKGMDERAILEAIDPRKDVDGVTLRSFAAMALGRGEMGFGCGTVMGVMELLRVYGVQVSGAHAVVLSRSEEFGKPMAMALLAKDATVTMCHSQTRGVEEWVKRAALLVTGVGRGGFVKGEWIKAGAVVVDGGYCNAGGVGDVEVEGAMERAGMFAPVPGGVGPMTIAMLLEQTVAAAERREG